MDILSATSPQISASVSASAGTGKTWLLVTRLVRLLLAGARPDAILAITFTRKAAAEMHSRLAERLLALASGDAAQTAQWLRDMGAPTDATTIDRARDLYETVLAAPRPLKTTTFHAFCQDLLRRFPLESDVPPGFELVENTVELEGKAWDALYSEATRAPDAPLGTALEHLFDHCGGLSGTHAALDGFLGHRSDWWAYTRDREDPRDYAQRRLKQLLGVDPQHDPIAAFFTPELNQHLAEFHALLAQHPSGRDHAKHLEALHGATAPDLTPDTRLELIARAFLTQKGQPLARKESKVQAQKMGDTGQARFLELHSILAGALLATFARRAAAAAYHANGAWYRAGCRLLEHYQRLKQEQRLLDFADLEWKAYLLLHHGDNAHWVQYKLDQRIDHLLVDEFQDTNPTQWQLILPLLQELAASDRRDERSVFLVGDAKQSIYRFRRADPALFDTARTWLSQTLGGIDLPMSTSRRSAPAIMSLVNAVFETPPLLTHIHPFEHHDTHHDTLWGRVEVLPLVEPAPEPAPDASASTLRNPLQQPRPIVEDTRYYREGQLIAARIHALITADTPVGPATAARPLHYRDIMILLRTRTHTGAYEQALREAQIPYSGADRGTLLNALEVRDMVALLETLVAPFNNLALATVLRCPLFACDHAELLTLTETGQGTWWERLHTLNEPSTTLLEARQLMAHWHTLAGARPIHDLLDHIFSTGDVLRRYEAAYPPHLKPRVRANLTRFLELALEIDSGRYPSIGHFLARLETLRLDTDHAPDEAPAGDADRVRIMTIHAAKGLEAPVVFLADATHGERPDRPYRPVVEWPSAATRPSAFLLVGSSTYRDPATQALLDHHAAAELREDANLLYVALTRAKQLLFITGCRPKRGEDLGWYGHIAEPLSVLANADDNGTLIIESGMPPSTTQPPTPTAVSTTAPDTRLTQPHTLSPLLREIAPSRSTTHWEPAGTETDDDSRVRGIAIHRMLQHLCEGTPATHIVTEVAAELGYTRHDARFNEWMKEAQAVYRHADFAHLFQTNATRRAYNEVPLSYLEGEQTVNGIIDRLIVDTEQVWIIDYKTVRQTDPTVLNAIAATYREQMRLYQAGVTRLWPDKQVTAALLFTHLPCLVPV